MNRNAGYTLVEVLVAAALLVIVVAGASAMALTLVAQEEMNARIARVQNHQEQLARLYQIGLSTADCLYLIPSEPAIVSPPVAVESLVDFENVGVIEKAVWTVVYRPNDPASWLVNSTATRSRTIEAYRPSIR